MSAESRAAADAARYEAQWGMQIAPDDRPNNPARMAWEAYQRGDRLFQVDVPVSYVQGNTAASLVAASRTVHPRLPEGQEDFLGQIEAQGWRLEHVSTTFATQGTTAAGNLMSATHGVVVGLYVFRRAEPQA